MSDDDLQRWVIDELAWDPKIDNTEIAVSADDGVVTLRGTVGSFHEKRDAQSAAERVYGVKSVKNELQVRILIKGGRKDAELRGDVLQALMLDSTIPSSVAARVDDGWVTLSGSVDWQYQRDEAERVAGKVEGVVGVDDQIDLEKPQPSPHDVEHSIEQALKRNAKLDAKGLSVDSHNGTVAVTTSADGPYPCDGAADRPIRGCREQAGAATMTFMHLTLAQSVAWVATGAAGWLMVRAGSAKRALGVKTASRCASCGRRREGRQRCECAGKA
jgi:osmotically-inducible protein OsmY